MAGEVRGNQTRPEYKRIRSVVLKLMTREYGILNKTIPISENDHTVLIGKEFDSELPDEPVAIFQYNEKRNQLGIANNDVQDWGFKSGASENFKVCPPKDGIPLHKGIHVVIRPRRLEFVVTDILTYTS